jgi:PBP1b-binding outer membrane lipoprotein LpoB
MKKIIALSVLALALTGCAAKEEEVAVEAAPAAEAPAAEVVAEEAPAAEAPAAEVGGVPQDVAAE